jgi:hypothetical protein
MATDALLGKWMLRIFRVSRGLAAQAIHSGFLLMRPGLNRLLVPLLRRRVLLRSVLHISYMVHIPYYTVRLLREQGYHADYLAFGRSPTWNKADYCYVRSHRLWLAALKEFWWFWRVVARYEIVHLHFMYMLSADGWELLVLRALGRRIVVHFRGCEARDRDRNMALHQTMNICQACDYDPPICQAPLFRLRRQLAACYADVTLVSTPDLKDFNPHAVHFTFFTPPDDLIPVRAAPRWPDRERLKIVHVTNHPGIEGTAEIQAAIERLQERGYPIEFVFLRGVTYSRVLAEFGDADLTIGKMKMGHYANAQIESLCCGVPAIAHVRHEFITREIQDSGLILATLDNLEDVLAHYMDHPEELAQKARIARDSVLRLHDNVALTRRLITLYEGLRTPVPEARQESLLQGNVGGAGQAEKRAG